MLDRVVGNICGLNKEREEGCSDNDLESIISNEKSILIRRDDGTRFNFRGFLPTDRCSYPNTILF